MIEKQKFYIGFKDVNADLGAKDEAILTVFEDIAGIHGTNSGDGFRRSVTETRVTWLLLEWKVNVIRRPTYGEFVTASTWVRDTKRCYSYREFELHGQDGTLLATAYSKWVYVNMDTEKPVSCGEELKAAYTTEDKTNFENITSVKIDAPQGNESTFEYAVNEEWIDMNRHMNNVHYITLAKRAIGADNLKAGEADRFEINYRKEIKLGEKVKCLVGREEGAFVVTVKSEDESVLHSVVKLYY